MANTYDTNVKLQAIATAIANSGTSDPNLLAKLQAIADAITGGSNTDYDNLTNKPQINSVTLSGNKTSSDLGLVASASVGVASGVAELDNTGHVPSSQLPSYVDDVVEGYYDEVTNKFYSDNAYTTEIPGETGKIYITLDTNLSYRYTGSGFVVVSPSLALGETSSTAYRGDRGKIAYDTSQSNATLLGNTSIAAIGDGTVTGAISTINNNIANRTALAKYLYDNQQITLLGSVEESTDGWGAIEMPFNVNPTSATISTMLIPGVIYLNVADIIDVRFINGVMEIRLLEFTSYMKSTLQVTLTLRYT